MRYLTAAGSLSLKLLGVFAAILNKLVCCMKLYVSHVARSCCIAFASLNEFLFVTRGSLMLY